MYRIALPDDAQVGDQCPLSHGRRTVEVQVNHMERP